MSYQLTFPDGWLEATAFENTLLNAGVGPHEDKSGNITFVFPVGCKIMIDAGLRLLSLANQLDHCSVRVTLLFEEGESGTMGYLNRLGFFDRLSPRVEVKPPKPTISTAEIYRGMNQGVVEIAGIGPNDRDLGLPTTLSSAVARACASRNDVAEIEGATWTIFAELIDNIFSHSCTQLNGFAALQVYGRGNSLKVAVSDSGLGIMETLRPTLKNDSPSLAKLSDIDLLVEIFRQGLSRHGSDRGCGLKGSAAKAMKFKADLDVRLPNVRVLLTPSIDGYTPNIAHCYDKLPLIWGTHISFTFTLDNQRQI